MRDVHILRRHAVAGLLAAVLPLLAPVMAVAADAPVVFVRPHCEKPVQTDCPAFEAQDPSTLRTAPLKPGDTLDLDVAVKNPQKQPIHQVRAWLSFDAQKFQGISITLSPSLPVPVPGESAFSDSEGFAKIAAAAAQGSEPSDEIVTVARVQLKVKDGVASGPAPISFYDQKDTAEGHTYVLTSADPAAHSIIGAPLGALVALIQAPAQAAGASSAPSSAAPVAAGTASSQASAVSSRSAPAGSVSFTLLQVQNLRATTKDTTLYAAWEPLASSELVGYNVYYGTQMGRYIQRRSLAPTDHGIAITGLSADTNYYLAVRGVSRTGQETAFSQEVAVRVGHPETSTSPLVGGLPGETPAGNYNGDLTAPPNPVSPTTQHGGTGSVPGEAGLSSTMILFIMLSAVIGTVIAMRRQLSVSPAPAHD